MALHTECADSSSSQSGLLRKHLWEMRHYRAELWRPLFCGLYRSQLTSEQSCSFLLSSVSVWLPSEELVSVDDLKYCLLGDKAVTVTGHVNMQRQEAIFERAVSRLPACLLHGDLTSTVISVRSFLYDILFPCRQHHPCSSALKSLD